MLLWFMLILGWRVGVHWRSKLKFLLDCLTAWQRVVLVCLLAIRQPSWWSKKEPHWYLHESFTSNGLGMTSCAHDFMWHCRQTTTDWWCLLIRGCMPWCSGICHPSPYCRHASWSFQRWWKQTYFGQNKVGCILLLIGILAWVLGRLKARLSLSYRSPSTSYEWGLLL